MEVSLAYPREPDVRALLEEHLADMSSISPPESCHALPVDDLADESVTLLAAREGGRLLGCGAIKELAHDQGEIKSMRTQSSARGRGVAAQILTELLELAMQRGYVVVRLETGTQDHFDPARRLYERFGFTECGPFGDYRLDPLSVFYERRLDESVV